MKRIKLSGVEADVEIWKIWERRSSEVAFSESHRELESQRLQLHQANLWADNAQIQRINLCGLRFGTCRTDRTKIVTVAKVQIIHTRNSSIVVLLPTKNTNNNDERLRTPNEPKMHDNDKTCFVFPTACLCPDSCETNDDRQIKMTEKDTPHAPKIMLTSIKPRQKWTGNTLIKDRYHWPHRP